MKDRRFMIALVVIALLIIALIYVLFVGPSLQGYVVQKQVDAQQNTVKTIMQIVDQQGYIVLTDNGTSVVLIKYSAQTQPQENISNNTE